MSVNCDTVRARAAFEVAPSRRERLTAFTLVCAVMGTGLTVCADSGWACAVSIGALGATLAAAFVIVGTVSDETADVQSAITTTGEVPSR